MRYILFILILILTISCGKSDLEIALDLAGDNAGELRKVLDFYSQKASDSLKYRAAVFLIENMPGHYSLGGKNVEAFYKSVDSLLLKEIRRGIVFSLSFFVVVGSDVSSKEDSSYSFCG